MGGRELTWRIKTGIAWHERLVATLAIDFTRPGIRDKFDVLIEYHLSIAPLWLLAFRVLPGFIWAHNRMRNQSFGSASPKVVNRKHIVDMAFLIPLGLRKCWIWKGFVVFDRIANMRVSV